MLDSRNHPITKAHIPKNQGEKSLDPKVESRGPPSKHHNTTHAEGMGIFSR